ncbi:branched-chain amino acid transport system substrate-binding protein [Rhodoblastus acidophilus]|uniref:ABC transporter substrate-binding protein n=1 Tax=Rhodoblastus acidophilus TaxID=1074 RepID=UPI002224E949|nr:ABC transporter substrate-binding protein [Rhodoblastus acidophilus]MCW2284432.1 branched-chain amino acid transport system substrate-binding protein [Rhodoblastus acidophilus]MCW2333279.1 branched-chain amino acid transport system substrate-binding protein [Rhodoblastus acidophilus]
MKKILLAGVALGVMTTCAFAADKVVKVGVLTDGSGPYADVGGVGSQLAAQLAIDESGLAAKGWKVELVYADHLNKVDVGTSIAREWFDQGKADVIVDTLNSGVALAVGQIVKDKNKVFLNSGAASSDLTGKACTPNQIHWTYDTYALANGTGKAMTKAGGDTWYFITADYAFGKALERDTTAVVAANGGKVVGNVYAPLNNADFSSQLLQAQSSKAKVIGLANAGGDSANAIKQAAEFGITQGGQKLAALLIFLSDVNALGLPVAQGLEFTVTYYWDLNDDTRAFADRFSQKSKAHAKPTMVQAGVYSSVLHYLKAVDALGSPTDGAAVVAKMKATPTDDQAFGKGSIREDGRKIHPAYLLQVKTPAESKYPWDYAKVIATIPADEAFRPLSQSECPLVKK